VNAFAENRRKESTVLNDLDRGRRDIVFIAFPFSVRLEKNEGYLVEF